MEPRAQNAPEKALPLFSLLLKRLLTLVRIVLADMEDVLSPKDANKYEKHQGTWEFNTDSIFLTVFDVCV